MIEFDWLHGVLGVAAVAAGVMALVSKLAREELEDRLAYEQQRSMVRSRMADSAKKDREFWKQMYWRYDARIDRALACVTPKCAHVGKKMARILKGEDNEG